MSKTTEVYLTEEDRTQTVNMTSDYKPEVTQVILDKWQKLINILATMMSVKAGLINRLKKESIEIFLKSDNKDNPYTIGLSDSVGLGAYCEMVVGKNHALEIHNAKKNPLWKKSPYTFINMISYYGLPLLWPDGEVFGTLCVLDNKENHFSDMFKNIFLEFKLSIEKDLELLQKHCEIKLITEQDALTSIYNRKKIHASLKNEFNRSKRYNHVFSIILLDIDNFKIINDTFGHHIGDRILILFSSLIKQHIRKTDIFGRWGSDEFLIICPGTNNEGAKSLITKMRENVMCGLIQVVREANYSYGTTVYKNSDSQLEDMIKRCYLELHRNKVKNRVEE